MTANAAPPRPLRRLLVGLAAVAVLILVAPACGDDADDSVAQPDAGGDTTTTAAEDAIPVPAELEDLTGQETVTVTVRDNAFDPRYIQVSPGTEIVWVNEGANTHNVTPAVDGSFEGIEAEALVPGEEPSVTFADAGEFPYYCSFHGTPTVGQTGYVQVVG